VPSRTPVAARSADRVRGIFRGLPRRYDLLVDVLTFGQNARWRRTMVDHALRGRPALVCDVATGTAGVAIQLARRSDARVVGVDLSPEMLAAGTRAVAAAGLGDRIALVLARGERLPFPDATFDALTFTYLLRYVPDPAAALRELGRVVRPGGSVASLEFHVPTARPWRWAWRLYTRVVLPLAGGLLGGRAWVEVGRFLGPNIEDHYRRHPLDAHVAAWHAAGLRDLEVREMSLGGGVVMAGRRDD
jgi:demethylmenaquinone methyltransferase / 2-methoxy-6-polyprenyl-1,4-benzoquinol methylase